MKARLNRAERAAGEHISAVTCPECGQTFRRAGDLALELVATQWVRETGEEYEADPTVERVLAHEHVDLLHEVLRDIPGLRDDRAR
jgi:hypothetical protein